MEGKAASDLSHRAVSRSRRCPGHDNRLTTSPTRRAGLQTLAGKSLHRAFVAGIFLIVGCGEVGEDAPPSPDLAGGPPVSWTELPPVAREFTLEVLRETRTLFGLHEDGSVSLSKPRAIVEMEDERLWILDSDWKRAFLIGPGDTVQAVVGGYGFGPGDFALPVAMTMDVTGRICVLDYERQDVPCFDKEGRLEGRIATGRVNATLVAADATSLLVVAAFSPQTRFAAVRLGGASRPVEELIPLEEADTFNGQMGSIGAISSGRSDELLYAHPLTGVWSVVSGGISERRGKPLYEPNLVRIGDGFVPRSVPWGVGQLTDDRIIILVRHVILQGDNLEDVRLRHTLEIYSREGHHLGRAHLPDEWGAPSFLSIGQSGHLYVSRTDPHPAVLTLRLSDQ
jgi:hypothetical protein